MNGERVGDWRLSSGGQEFVYAESWLHQPESRPISLSFPLRPASEPYRKAVPEFFDNLLPDSRAIRERIQRRFGAPSMDAFDLLHEIGRDCIGALQLLPENHPSGDVRKITGTPLTDREIAAHLAGTTDSGFGLDERDRGAFRISLAGAQEKTALLRWKGAWHLPAGATPTTHIFKLPMGSNSQGIDLSSSVENEWICAQLVHAYGISVAPCTIHIFGEQKALVVERFDRQLSADKKWFQRLPQEDFCQATATPLALKYESDGGPGIEQIMELLLGSQNSADDRRDFMRTVLVFWLLAAIDGHAKNFSLFLLRGGAYRLTPRYDILSAYPVMGHGRGKLSPEKIKMAMALRGKNRHYRWKEISARHWLETAKRTGFSEMNAVMEEIIELTPRAISKVSRLLPKNFPLQVADPILEGIAQAARTLSDQLAR